MCSICHGSGTITEPSPFTYRFGDWITRPCDCAKARDPPSPIISADALKYAALERRNALEAMTK